MPTLRRHRSRDRTVVRGREHGMEPVTRLLHDVTTMRLDRVADDRVVTRPARPASRPDARSHKRVDPSISVNRNVTVPLGCPTINPPAPLRPCSKASTTAPLRSRTERRRFAPLEPESAGIGMAWTRSPPIRQDRITRHLALSRRSQRPRRSPGQHSAQSFRVPKQVRCLAALLPVVHKLEQEAQTSCSAFKPGAAWLPLPGESKVGHEVGGTPL